ncbi:MAG: hypothetical protein JSR79_12355 [Proteobacteria bacterium]|nr:hypothetical protein [Pseudomonadota bacterium]
MKFSTIVGAAIGNAIDGRKGDDSTIDGAIAGAATAAVVRVAVPLAITFATGWLVLRGIGKARNAVFGPKPATE